MASLSDVAAAIERYHAGYRHPSLPTPLVSGLYSLWPDAYAGSSVLLTWPNPWPNADKPGVYLVLDGALGLLYIGKAAVLGQRISTYFRYAADGSKSCALAHAEWSIRPVYVVTVALSEKFEPPSLEEYLISKFNPPDNKTWTTKPPVAVA